MAADGPPGAMKWPPGSEILVSAATIKDMVRIVEHHGLVPVPVDLDTHFVPDAESLRRSITPRTRAVLVAHLFGSRFPMEPVIEFAREHGLFVIEDCAQAFAGRTFLGHPQADASMFSFGPIKTATALGGAVLRIRDPELLQRMRTTQAGYAVQSRWYFLRRLLKYSGLKLGTARPVFTPIAHACRVLYWDLDAFINNSVHGFSGSRFFARIRRQPSGPLLVLLAKRLRTYDARRLAKRASSGRLLVDLLHDQIPCPAGEIVPHSFWVFPVLVDDPGRVIARLAEAGFDATQGRSMCVVQPPPDRADLEPRCVVDAVAKMVYLPFGPEMSNRALKRMAEVLLSECNGTAVGR
jgi:dTDP-4-amino-4,6-dideoxygalactose transaminase